MTLRLDTIENTLLNVNTFFTLLLAVIGMQAYVAGVLAMNLNWDFLASLPHGFLLTFIFTMVMNVVGAIVIWEFLKYIKFVPT